jgi:hypothetical protein
LPPFTELQTPERSLSLPSEPFTFTPPAAIP